MKTKTIYRLLLAAGAIVTVSMFSCNKDLDKTNPNSVGLDQSFKTAADLQTAVNAAYSVIKSSSLVGREWFFVHDLRSDDVATGGSQLEAPRAQILNGGTQPSNPVMNSVWNALYTAIHRANTAILKGPGVTDNPALRDRIVGEAKFLRGWAYFDLVSMWGKVPMYTMPVQSFSDSKSRSSVDSIYAQIIQDLKDAAANLPGKSGYDAANRGRVTNAAANAMLGRVYMQKGDYASAKAALLLIPTTGADGYSLTARFLDNFEEEHEFNNESILEVIFVDKKTANFNWGGQSVGDVLNGNTELTTVRNQEYCPVAWRNLIPSDKILNEFENSAFGAAKTDPRFSWTVYQSGDKYNNGAETLADGDQNGNGSTFHGAAKKMSWRKFMLMYKMSKSAMGFYPGGNNQRLIRFADVLLMLAECENELGNSAAAVGYLNQVRDRPDVMMPHYPTAQYPTGTKDQVTKAIMHERSVELADEEVRNIDIMRWRIKGYYPSIAPEPLSYFQKNRDELLPIPQAELDNNPKVTGDQNPGY
ncbi:RagB/SusD family nutrient uptake outer membrane protein [Chitinophagaceae bacterium 26-R-25]|nr:RagB/SusD family nutrient uptake outer membrane protein [Chitinophagaceae bacterium 26-R-25]